MSKIKKIVSLVWVTFCCIPAVFSQQAKPQNIKAELRKGNELYRQKKYKEAQNSYSGALQKDPASYTGMFNMGDALYRDKKYENARQVLTASAQASRDKKEQASAYHNIGNTFLEEKKWEEAINAYKQALRLNPADADTKYNLAYANAMLKKDSENKDKKDKDKKDDKKDKDKKDQDKKDQDKKDQDKKDQDKKDQNKKDGDPKQDKGDKDKQEQQRPQGQPSKLNQQQADNLLNALRQEEKKLQDKKGKEKGVPVKMEKDW